MEFTLTKRSKGKTEAKRARREKKIPAIIYSEGKSGEEVLVDGIEFQKLLDKIEKGTLSSKKLTLTLDGKNREAIVKDIQYHPTTYDILHIDFEELKEGVPVNINIPLQCIGVMDCAGIKLGGVLRQVIRYVKVRCLPKDIPSHFELDVRALAMNQVKKLRDIALPENVRPLVDLKEVAVIIAKK